MFASEKYIDVAVSKPLIKRPVLFIQFVPPLVVFRKTFAPPIYPVFSLTNQIPSRAVIVGLDTLNQLSPLFVVFIIVPPLPAIIPV